MKLSEILKPVDKYSDYSNKEYITFIDCEAYIITLLNLDDADTRNYYKCENANINYIRCYLNLNMDSYKQKLFTPTISTIFGDEITHKVASSKDKYIMKSFNDIEIGDLPPIEFQDKIAEPLKKLYFNVITSCEEECEDLEIEIIEEIKNMKIVKVADLYDLCKITDMQLFLESMFKFYDQYDAEDYIKVTDPNVVYADYLVFYIYYRHKIFDSKNYIENGFDVKDIKLPSISDQLRFVHGDSLIYTRRKIRENKMIINENKTILRDMINSF